MQGTKSFSSVRWKFLLSHYAFVVRFLAVVALGCLAGLGVLCGEDPCIFGIQEEE